ncbi:hypothetical protein VH441_06455 [Psychrobacter sp. HD31]|uniref:anti-sigma factor family protein n=1 Tax=Psychrobacter sp. HD31 TaxID=3112003 RepID=UPI003DA5CDD8
METQTPRNHSSSNPMHKMMLSCYKATELVSLSYERKLSRGEQFKLYTHTMMCKGCRQFLKNTEILDNMLQAHKEYEKNAKK